MHEFLRRLAIHGGLTAILLGIVGVVLADMAASSELTPTGARTPTARSPEELAAAEKSAASLRTTIPLAMAVWGFVFVALFEGIRRYLWPRRTPIPAAATQPDETEKLLEELLNQAEAKSAHLEDAPPPEQTPQPSKISAGELPRQTVSASVSLPTESPDRATQSPPDLEQNRQLPDAPKRASEPASENWENLGKDGHWW